LRKQKRNFALIFRTFGSDLEGLKLEFNRFCEGTHPLFDGNNGTTHVKFDGIKTKEMTLNNANVGNMYRFADVQVFLVLEEERRSFKSALNLCDF